VLCIFSLTIQAHGWMEPRCWLKRMKLSHDLPVAALQLQLQVPGKRRFEKRGERVLANLRGLIAYR
jgi:hypothetical protein